MERERTDGARGGARPHSGLLTDLYQLTMAAGYWTHGMEFPATFELSVRRLPPDRGYLVAAGIGPALDYVAGLSFSGEEIDFLRGLPVFAGVDPRFFERLRGFRFTGAVRAVPEGTLVFAHEPIVQVTAPLLEAQLLETWLLSTVNFQTLIATKAARVVEAARGRPVVEFGLRRAHGPEAGTAAARAAFVGGCAGTSNVLAGMTHGIPVFGTAAHSWTLACPSEEEAFRRYREVFPRNCLLLIDTFDTLTGARRAAALGPDLAGVRLDSGDFLALSREVRRILDEAGLHASRIVLSGDLNEYKIDALVRAGAPVDLFGVGTELVTSRDCPALGGVYKLVEAIEDGVARPVMKLSPDKVTLPGRKQVFRRTEAGRAVGDVLALDTEALSGAPLLVAQIEAGHRVAAAEDLESARARVRAGLAALPDACRRIAAPDIYPVEQSPGLRALVAGLRSEAAQPLSVSR